MKREPDTTALSACKTVKQVEDWQDREWAKLQRTDAKANTRVLELAKVRKIEIKGK